MGTTKQRNRRAPPTSASHCSDRSTNGRLLLSQPSLTSIVGCILVLLQLVWMFDSASAFAAAVTRRGGGGRAPSTPDAIVTITKEEGATSTPPAVSWKARASQPQEARLIVLQITDVYTLEHLASFKTLLEETRANANGAKVICVLTGDFLSPYVSRVCVVACLLGCLLASLAVVCRTVAFRIWAVQQNTFSFAYYSTIL